jgi:hypothetical protein
VGGLGRTVEIAGESDTHELTVTPESDRDDGRAARVFE